MNLIIEIAWTHVSTRLRQTFVAVLGVAMGVAFTIMMSGLMQGRQRDFIRQLVDTMPHVTIRGERRAIQSRPAEQAYAAAQPTNPIAAGKQTGIKDPNGVIASIRPWLPGAIAPATKTTVMMHLGKGRYGVTLIGIDPRQETAVSKLASQMRAGQMSDLYRGSNAFIVGDGLAKKMGAQVGTTVNVSAGEGIIIPGSIVGIFRSGLREVDEGQIYGLIRTAQVLAGQPGVINEIRIQLTDARVASDIAKRIEAQTGYRAVPWQEANADLLSAFAIGDLITWIIMGAMLLVSTFGIYSIISTITNEKRHDIAIMKSFGMKEHLVRTIFITESTIIGAIGVMLGSALGYSLCLGVSQVTFSNPFSGEVQPVPMYYAPTQYLAIAAVALLACAAAAFIPARKASRVHPVDIIRGAA
jgi:lipoprotein-releasing system permease protein